MLLKDKNAFITGTNRGLGRKMMESFAEQGANVWAHARSPSNDHLEVAYQLKERYRVQIHPVYFDVNDAKETKKALNDFPKSFQSLDIIVNNAGVAHGGLFQMTTMKTIRDVFETNFFAPLEIIQFFVRRLVKQHSGSVINVASIAGIDLCRGNIAYGVSKAAIIAATQTLAAELGPNGIRVNAIAPGLTDTDMALKMESRAAQDMIARSAMKRLATTNEIVDVVVFLASDASRFINGQVIRVDGGSL
jgi:3-oxoacyl-[acyl-carrier protein] reductase